MTFQPDHKFSPGRRHGSRNKRTAEIFNRLESRGDLDPADLLSSIVTNPQEQQELRIQAAGLLMPYKYGKHGIYSSSSIHRSSCSSPRSRDHRASEQEH